MYYMQYEPQTYKYISVVNYMFINTPIQRPVENLSPEGNRIRHIIDI